ncbi:FAD-binding domain-containing protein [Caenorhabditis elegans]|uniref:FAD-binding domain-containing protein n=2 Tax=Caenorhabditis elegans TaxID=6239 RepID=B5BM30_CAEEL|nr:FAD-binding domain-containing protein [Caenorhabditis elegans]CAR31498.1 FAD-binding domain-containing protein [Caenorhabditis elegans]|eukprot:NP_001129902.1 Kynurenine 3-MonoOxygenase [Caenorhabditis elegans]
MPSVVIAGGGLVGSANACFFGQKGWIVDVYESRFDPRGNHMENGKSINLALGVRAMSTMKRIGLKEKVIHIGVPIRDQIAHFGDTKGKLKRLPVLNDDDFILTINRQELSQILINEAEKYNNVKFHFNCKATKFDLKSESLIVQNSDNLSTVDGDLFLACDGAHSSIRRSLLKAPGFNFSQKYSEFGYIDLSVNSTQQCDLKLGTHYSWRRRGIILVAIVNKDQSLTVSMFATFSEFESNLVGPVESVLFFKNNFYEIFKILGEDHIRNTIARNKPQAIISVQCSQHVFFDKLVLMGDAAHAMVPFNGQGVNCGFEDCLVLQEIMDQYEEDELEDVIKEYSKVRTNETNIINQMEWDVNLTLTSSVHGSLGWIREIRAHIKLLLCFIFPSSFTLAAFSREKYSEIARKAQIVEKCTSLFTNVFIVFIISVISLFWYCVLAVLWAN